MAILLNGIVLFFGIHLFTSTPLRSVAVSRVGDKAYKGIFSLLSLVGLGLIIWGFVQARSEPDAVSLVYNSPQWSAPITSVLVLVGLIMIASSHGKGHIRKIVRQPMSVGIVLWAMGHLLSNAHTYEVILFGSFLAYAVFDIMLSTAKGKRPSYTPKVKADIIAIVAGAVLFTLILFFHSSLFGASVI